ncbi:metallophosphoesterase [Rhizobacter sp. Root404]|uniref:metallophosphoesterase n=1 Tax=Rhizobacter sp. Root404 TaxID=1736528 RepID=UPI0006FF4BCB|nr:metallophosphoesterase [Rhizobacter sp. Root404]KQW34712.1 serine/threonine protein phosphatase [Rhizobacter sp. Root404]
MSLFLISALLHAYVGWRVVPDLPAGPGTPVFVTLLVASATLMPMALLARRVRQPWSDRLAWAGALAMGLFSSLFVLTLARDVLLLVAALVGLAAPAAFDPSALALCSAVAVPLLGLAASAWGFVNARRTAAVVSVDVPIAGLPAALHGFTIAQISDIHVGPTIKRAYLGRIVAAVNAIGADMVAVTGDLVDGSVRELAGHVAPLASLTSTHGTFFVTGNHEYYSGAPAWVAELRRLGLRVLMNEHVVLQHAGAALVVAGVTDFGAHHFDEAERSDPQAALAGAPVGAGARLLLAHQPRSAEAAERAGFQLQLSGHTHGGQFLPWNLFVRFQQPFTAGLHRWRRLWVYTSRGTGYWGPPKRFGAPSEITRLRLVPAPG